MLFRSGGNLWLMLLGVLIVFAIIQIATDALIVPKIMGSKMGLSPAIILLSLSVFGVLFGFLGLIIALPVTTIAISYYKTLHNRQRDYNRHRLGTTNVKPYPLPAYEEMITDSNRLIVVLGPTACGKTHLATLLASRINGQIKIGRAHV